MTNTHLDHSAANIAFHKSLETGGSSISFYLFNEIELSGLEIIHTSRKTSKNACNRFSAMIFNQRECQWPVVRIDTWNPGIF